MSDYGFKPERPVPPKYVDPDYARTQAEFARKKAEKERALKGIETVLNSLGQAQGGAFSASVNKYYERGTLAEPSHSFGGSGDIGRPWTAGGEKRVEVIYSESGLVIEATNRVSAANVAALKQALEKETGKKVTKINHNTSRIP